MTIDEEGMLWIAHWNGWQITRWDPDSGQKLFCIQLPVANVTSCIFGGADLVDLYITSARAGLTRNEIKKQQLAGSLFVIRNSGFKGVYLQYLITLIGYRNFFLLAKIKSELTPMLQDIALRLY
jgi:sugar lactone lactonase YvrE